MSHDARAVANAMIMKGVEDGKPLTPLQIIKLTYLCQAWMLAMYGRPIFRQKVKAWQHGPVISQVYHSVKHYGKNPVHTTLNVKPAIFSQKERHIIDEVYRVYGNFSGLQLSSLTHVDGSPWDQVTREYSFRNNQEISHSLMEQYYGDQLAQSENSIAKGRREMHDKGFILEVEVRKSAKYFVAVAETLDLVGQGATIEDAVSSLEDAVELFFETIDEDDIEKYLARLETTSIPRPVERRNNRQIVYIGSVKNEDGNLETRKVFVPDEKEIDTDSIMMIIRRSGIPREEFE